MSLLRTMTLGISLLLGGCATGQVVVDSYCQSYSIIRPSRKDTPDTLKQVLRENNKYRSVCEVKR